MNLVNGKSASSISLFDRGFLYGDSIFETVLVVNKEPKNLKLHLKRIKKGCNQLKIKNFKLTTLLRYLNKSLHDVNSCILSINITRGTAKKRGYNINIGNRKPNIILTTSNIPNYPKEYSIKGIFTKFAKTTLSSSKKFSKIKHSNRLEQIIATAELKNKYPEIILCDENNFIVEGISSNIFFVKGDIFYTPIIDKCGVEGVMKAYIIDLLKKNKIKVIHKKIKKNEIKNYDGAFFCNSIRLIWNILSINNHKYQINKNILNLTKTLNYETYK